MHDVSELEARGIPSAFVVSAEFEEASAAQSRALGFEPRCVFVPHPIQDRTDAEMRELAEAAAGEVIAALTRPL